LCATAAIDAVGEHLNDVFHAPIVADYAQQTSRQQRDDNQVAHILDATAHISAHVNQARIS